MPVLTPTVSSPSTRDFTSAHAYKDAQPLVFYEGEGAQHRTETIDLNVPQQDVGNNPNEMPSPLGRNFSQNEFSHGSGQRSYHLGENRSDPAKYLWSEGFDISEPGLLQHLNAVLENGNLSPAFSGGSGKMAQADGKLFVADGNSVLVFDPITGTPTTENPHDGESAVPVLDLTAEGDRIIAALGVNGLHIRETDGNWNHYGDAPAGVGYILVEFLKDRIIATSDREFYEVTASGAAPTGKQPLNLGWTYTDLAENGPFIFASCNDGNSLSKVFNFGLDNTLAVTVQGSTWLPNEYLVYSIKGYLGLVMIGCGKVNNSGGKDAVLFKAVPDSEGFLPLDLVAESEGAGSRDLSVKAMATQGRNFLVGWSLGTAFPYGEREGLAKYDPALDAFSTHLASSIDTATPNPVLSASVFEGRIVFATAEGVFYEDTTKKVAQATLISSIGSWNGPEIKNWDQTKLSTKKLPATSSVEAQYTLVHPEENVWSIAGEHTITDATTAAFRHANVEAARFTVKLISNATTSQTTAPEIESFAVRSNPSVDSPPWRLIRTLHLDDKYARGFRGAVKYQNPREVRDDIRESFAGFFDWFEADTPNGYYVRLVKIVEIISVTAYQQTQGNPRDEEYAVVVELRGEQN